MIEMFVSEVGLDPRLGQPFVVLMHPSAARAVRVWLASSEAEAIVYAAQTAKGSRPIPQDLSLDILRYFGYRVLRVEISSDESKVFYAALVITAATTTANEGWQLRIDARPSDAIALALRANVPIYVAPDVLYSDSWRPEGKPQHDAERAFRAFLEGVKASDFTDRRPGT